MKKYNFRLRIYKDEINIPVLSSIQKITISEITILSKHNKFSEICIHKNNQKKYKYKIRLNKKFNLISGSNSLPTLTFKGEYIDIYIYNFPRYPCFSQSKDSVNNYLNGFEYTNYINNGFPNWLKYRKYEIINI